MELLYINSTQHNHHLSVIYWLCMRAACIYGYGATFMLHWCSAMLHWCYSDVTLMFSDVTVMLHWCSAVLHWCYSDVTLMLHWCYRTCAVMITPLKATTSLPFSFSTRSSSSSKCGGASLSGIDFCNKNTHHTHHNHHTHLTHHHHHHITTLSLGECAT